MDVHDTVEELTRACMEIRRNLESTCDTKDREKLVLTHIKAFANKPHRINDFQAGLEWFNVSEGLSMKRDLVGKITILDFFTYCCINCMHILPDLSALEKQFSIRDGLVVVGVHSAKFANEKDSKQILSAVQRYNITHPVVNDAKLSTWRDLGISCWPTLIMIGPSGEPLAVFVGEGHREELFVYVDVAITYFKSLNRISDRDIPLYPARHLLPIVGKSSLLFPGKVTIFRNAQVERLVISDTGNNRILVTDMTGIVEHVIGGNNPGFRDGNFDTVRFNAPQGVCTLGDTIYVADNENHAIRKIDLKKKMVITVAGTGCQGQDYVGGKAGEEQDLSSPWDVAVYKYEYGKNVTPILLIAIAGTHQIWALFLEDTIWWKNRSHKAGTCAAIVGSGREENRNNSYPHAAGLAQPSGIVVVQQTKNAFFVDSESSAIRRIDLKDGRVSAVCGGNKNPADLHDFGDVDGIQYSAKLQHPLGLTWNQNENVVYVTDTYNHKIKRIDPTNNQCKTVYGGGQPSKEFSFDEPGDVTISSDGTMLYVADTNNHAVKVIDLKNEKIATLSVKIPSMGIGNSKESTYVFETVIDEKGGELKVGFDVTFLESDQKLNGDSPQTWSIDIPMDDCATNATSGKLSEPLSLLIFNGNETLELHITLDIVTCKTTECIPKRLSVLYRVHRQPHGPSVLNEQRQLCVK